jgi:hypothetical protein
MKQGSLNRSEIVTIAVGETSGTKEINLKRGTLLAVAKFDSGNAPGFLRIGVEQNGKALIDKVHHSAYKKSGGGGRYIDQYKQIFAAVDGTYQINASTDTAVENDAYKFEMEFIIVDEEQLPFFKVEE